MTSLPVHRIANPDLRLAFLPTVGGRLISLEVGGVELLWRNPAYLDAGLGTVLPRSAWAPLDGSMGSWPNLGGSKTWPAPQGWSGPDQWPGPPDPVLDSGEYTLTERTEADGTTVVVLESADDPRTGLRITREVWLPPTGTTFRQVVRLRAVADRPVSWAAWEVCQLDTEVFAASVAADPEAGVWVGVAGAAEPAHQVALAGRAAVGPVVGGRRRVEVSDVVAKVGFPDADGTLELRRPDGAGVAWRYAVGPGCYPDGCRAEIWLQYPTAGPVGAGLHPVARLVELEALSPLVDLAPGEQVELGIEWTAWGPRGR